MVLFQNLGPRIVISHMIYHPMQSKCGEVNMHSKIVNGQLSRKLLYYSHPSNKSDSESVVVSEEFFVCLWRHNQLNKPNVSKATEELTSFNQHIQ